MLSIERKKTDKVDLIKPIQKYIQSHYSEKSANDHTEALNNLNQLREDIRNAVDKSDVVKELLLKYYTLLNSVELRFPVSENNVIIKFYWTDYVKGKKSGVCSLHWERANVLFNYGALLSQLGAIQNRNSADGLKVAASYFQAAAGAFTDLKEYVAHHPVCSTAQDLSSDSLTMLAALMLGQAQACVVDKAIKDNMKDGIVAKLAAYAVECFETAVNLLNGPLVKYVDRTWATNVELWLHLERALVQQKMATIAAESMKCGEQVRRLTMADSQLAEARKKVGRSTPADLKELVEKQSAVITRAKQLAEKDNDSIYNDTIPHESQIAPVEKKALVKTVAIVDASTSDPFAALVPFVVKEAAAKYREAKDNMIRSELLNLDDHNEIAKVTLTSMNLPGAIEALETPDGLPQGLVTKANQIAGDKGPSLISELQETLRNLADEDASLLKKCEAVLDAEEEEDNAMRAQYGDKWKRTYSHTLTPGLRGEAAKYRGHIDHARKSDAFITTKWKDHGATIALLAGSKDELLRRLPSNKSTGLVNVAPLKKVLADLDALIAAREQTKAELNSLSSKDDIAKNLLGGRAYEDVYAEELKKYDPILNKLRENYIRQGQLLEAVRTENDVFVASRRDQVSAGVKREEVLTQFSNAHKAYTEMKAGLHEGIQFYTNLQEILKQFLTKCEDFKLARTTEKSDMVVSLNAPQVVAPPSPTPSAPSAMPGAWQPHMQPVYGVPPPYPYGAQAPPYQHQQYPYGNAPPPPYGSTQRR